jgi:hypothetical protein
VLVRYEAGLTRTFERALKQLTQLQSAPRPGAVKHVGSFRKSPSPPSRGVPRPRPAVSIGEPKPAPLLLELGFNAAVP